MNVCLVSTYRRLGGAAVAAYRLKDALEIVAGFQVSELYRYFREGEGMIDRLSDEADPLAAAGGNVGFGAVERFERDYVRRSLTSEALTLFSLGTPVFDLSQKKECLEADVINLHWVSFLQNPVAIRNLARLGKPIVWTLHDERAFTGGCHYSGGCEGFTADCRACPQVEAAAHPVVERLLAERVSLLREVPLHFVSPSHWLGSQLTRSRLFNSECHTLDVIPYSLDLQTFRPVDGPGERSALRERFGLPHDEICILAGSMRWEEERKGGRLLNLAFEELFARLGQEVPEARVCIVTCGTKEQREENFPTHNVGLVESEEGMAELIRCCDLFATMTREDNLPNMVLEALACGVPVLATEVGGVPEMVIDGTTGRLVRRDGSTAMAEALFEAIRDSDVVAEWSRNARRFARDNYAHPIQAVSYRNLFERLLSKEPAPQQAGQREEVGSAVELMYQTALGDLRAREAQLRAQQAKLQAQRVKVQSCNETIRILRASFSYRLGAALTRPLRPILRLLRKTKGSQTGKTAEGPSSGEPR